MTGRNNFRDLSRNFTPKQRQRVEAKKAELLAATPLNDPRRARAMTRKAMGEPLHEQQPAVAKLERRADMYVSNLRHCIEAFGGKLSIVAEFPQGKVAITDFAGPATENMPE